MPEQINWRFNSFQVKLYLLLKSGTPFTVDNVDYKHMLMHNVNVKTLLNHRLLDGASI